MELTISIDDVKLRTSISDETFQKFVSALVKKREEQDVVIERAMLAYAEENSPLSQPSPPPQSSPELLTEKLLEKFRQQNIGRLAEIVLGELLKRGVAPEWEIEEFQKASGIRTCKRLKLERGFYVKKIFGLPFPLLITEKHRQFDIGNNFFVQPLKVNGNEYYLCSQWNENNHREKLEAWIREHLPAWLATTDEQSRNEMIRWIKNQL